MNHKIFMVLYNELLFGLSVTQPCTGRTSWARIRPSPKYTSLTQLEPEILFEKIISTQLGFTLVEPGSAFFFNFSFTWIQV